jgi:tRNA nucleotidyltransferase (CCA-adding enzyme)
MSAAEDTLETLRGLPAVQRLAAALARRPAYLVGGTVRDALLGLPAGDLDLAFDAEPETVWAEIAELGPLRRHERFGTATLELPEGKVDLARTRAEIYPSPGALPEVDPAPIEEDLRRRDFTVNAMALPLAAGEELIDPLGGREDLEHRQLRILHQRSFLEDPTRLIRAARYCSRHRFRLEERTEEAAHGADLSTVSADRVEAELTRLAEEADPVAALRLLVRWEALAVEPERIALAEEALRLLADDPWRQESSRPAALRLATWAPPEELDPALELAASPAPESPSQGSERARALSGPQLLLARAAGAGWLDTYLGRWRGTRLEIGGEDLLACGVPEGPAIGAALADTRRALLDGEISAGREPELRHALEVVGIDRGSC